MAFSLRTEVRDFENDPAPGHILLIGFKGFGVGLTTFLFLYFLFR